MSRIAGTDESPLIRVKLGSYTVAVSTTSGILLSWANPFGRTILVHDLICDVTTPSTGASTIDIGVAVDAVTGADNLIDGVSGATAGVLNSIKNAGTNGTSIRKVTASQFINAEAKTGDVNGIAMTLYATVSFL